MMLEACKFWLPAIFTVGFWKKLPCPHMSTTITQSDPTGSSVTSTSATTEAEALNLVTVPCKYLQTCMGRSSWSPCWIGMDRDALGMHQLVGFHALRLEKKKRQKDVNLDLFDSFHVSMIHLRYQTLPILDPFGSFGLFESCVPPNPIHFFLMFINFPYFSNCFPSFSIFCSEVMTHLDQVLWPRRGPFCHTAPVWDPLGAAKVLPSACPRPPKRSLGRARVM